MIEIEIHHRHAAAISLRLRDRVDDAVAEKQPVRKSGQRVVVGLIFELLLRRFALRDVAVIEHDRADARLVQHVLRERLQPDPDAAAMAKTQFRL